MAKSRQKQRSQTIEAEQVRRLVPTDPVLRKCYICGGQMEGRHQNYQFKECGLDNVVLIGVLVFHCQCGEIAVQLPATGMLHRVIALQLIKKTTLLSGEEVRFLRKHLDYSATEFAAMLGTTKVSMSRWENGKVKITKNTDRLLRLAFFMASIERYAEEAVGPDDDSRISEIVAFAREVKSFNLTAFLKQIRDVHEQSSIKIDPCKLAEFGAAESCTARGGSSLVN